MRKVMAAMAAGWFGISGLACAETLPLPDTLIALPSAEGEALLYGAEARADFAALSAQFTTQVTPTFCGPATMAMVLNALHVDRPASEATVGLGLFDQENVFTDAVEAVKPRDQVVENGMSLQEFADALAAHGLKVTMVEAVDTDLASFRDTAIATLNDRDTFLMVNYLRSAMGQETGGHISPVAAYDADTDRFLVLDVSRYKYPPVWVPAPLLFDAMATGGDDWSRGYVVAGR